VDRPPLARDLADQFGLEIDSESRCSISLGLRRQKVSSRNPDGVSVAAEMIFGFSFGIFAFALAPRDAMQQASLCDL